MRKIEKFDLYIICLAVIIMTLVFANGYMNQEQKLTKAEQKLESILSMARHEQEISPWTLIELIEGIEEIEGEE